MDKYEALKRKSEDRQTNEILKQIHYGITEQAKRFLMLITVIPNWQSYLTIKQLEVAELYIKGMNAIDIDYKLNLSNGITQQRLFGGSSSKGAIGRLEEAYERLTQQGYYERQKIKKANKKPTVSRISQKTKDKVRELIKLAVELQDYEKYLTKSQLERINKFLELKNIKACAKYFDVTETTFKQSLLGRNDHDNSGILGRLKKAYSESTVSNWEDL